MTDLKVGQMIDVIIRRGGKKTPETWKVHSLYPRFAVLDNGLYKTCAFYCDLATNWSILVHQYS